ncbi:MAG: hypothetical protein HPY79_01090 [Bacteroidales bacterium]|nr:hypothetical protein [Bacteroidales bacterium]
MYKIAVLTVDNQNSISQVSKNEPEINPLPYLKEYITKQFFLSKNNSFQILENIYRHYDICLNLCDGAEGDDRPGIEVVQFLEKKTMPFTGAGSAFYEPSRIAMKDAALKSKVMIPAYQYIHKIEELSTLKLQFPIIVKHFNSYSSIGLTKESVVFDFDSLQQQTRRMLKLYKKVLLESYIEGDEYTVLVASVSKNEVKAYYPAKIIFPHGEHFKYFDLKWQNHHKMKYIPCPNKGVADLLMEKSIAIYKNMNGSGYARFDYRIDKHNNLYFLELNPNCSLFYPPNNASSADEILSFKQNDKQTFVNTILSYAVQRFQ